MNYDYDYLVFYTKKIPKRYVTGKGVKPPKFKRYRGGSQPNITYLLFPDAPVWLND